ncbi:MAG: REP-associated tyrosine transposase [Opitutales bacterium]
MILLPQRSKLPHETPCWVRAGATYFITICCRRRGVDQLCNHQVAEGLYEAVEFRQHTGRWHVHLLVLMPDHLHALVVFPREGQMTRMLSSFKENTAKRVGIQWQRDFFDHRLRINESYEEKANYIRMNPVRAALVKDPVNWPWRWEPSILTNGGPSGPALPRS